MRSVNCLQKYFFIIKEESEREKEREVDRLREREE
jgi:hypothetical protein